MQKMKTAALAVLLACGLVRADVFEKLPADALVAGRINNLTATSAKIAKLAKDLGVDAFVTQLRDPLGAVKGQSKLEKGLNDAGDIGFAYMDPKMADGKEDEAFVFVLPVTNYAEFLSNFPSPKTDGAVSEVTPPDGGDKPVFVADWGGYAAMSPSKALVSKPAATMKNVEATAKEAVRQDFLVVANFKELAPKLMPQLDKGLSQLTGEIDKLGPDKIDAKYKPLLQAALNQGFAAAKTFLNSADAATVGLNISDAGINTTVLSAFRPDSYLGKFASGLKGTDKPLTIGLPAMKMMAYGGSTIDPKFANQAFDDISKPIIVELEKIDGLTNAAKLVATWKAAVGKMTGNAFGVPVPTKIGQEGLLQNVVIYHGGATEMKSLFAQGGTFAKQFVADMKLPPDRPKPTLETLPNAKTIEGVSFDSIKFQMKVDPNAPGAAMQERMQELFNGPDGTNYQFGAIGEDFILATNAGDETIGAFIKSLKAGEDNVSKMDQVKVVAAELPKMRVVEYYVALDEVVNTGVATAAQFGLPVQVQLPPELPPLGVTFGADGTSLRFDTHLPTSTVQSLIAAGMQAFMGMRGGGGGNL